MTAARMQNDLQFFGMDLFNFQASVLPWESFEETRIMQGSYQPQDVSTRWFWPTQACSPRTRTPSSSSAISCKKVKKRKRVKKNWNTQKKSGKNRRRSANRISPPAAAKLSEHHRQATLSKCSTYGLAEHLHKYWQMPQSQLLDASPKIMFIITSS